MSSNTNTISGVPPLENMDLETELQTFMKKYAGDLKHQMGKKPQVPVKELRHIIPLLIMNLYGVRADSAHKKSKGQAYWVVGGNWYVCWGLETLKCLNWDGLLSALCKP